MCYMDSNKLHVHGTVRLLNIFSFVFLKSNSDFSSFVKVEFGMHVVVLLYVDDMIITECNVSEISRLCNDLSIRFEMKNLGEVECFLGLEVEKAINEMNSFIPKEIC